MTQELIHRTRGARSDLIPDTATGREILDRIHAINAELRSRGEALPEEITPAERAQRLAEVAEELRRRNADTAPAHKPWVSNAEAHSLSLPDPGETAVFDPDATVVIGRHRQDGTREYRVVGEPEPQRTRRGGWRAWATVSRLWRRGRAEVDA